MGKFQLLATTLVLSFVLAPQARSQTKTEMAPGPNAASPATAAEAEPDAPVTDCDKYAASPLDPELKAEGVPPDAINAALAVPACESAVGKYPKSVRLMYQLGRAYYRKKEFILAAVQYRKAAELGYLSAQNNLGYIYGRGEGVARDYREAARWTRKAAEKGLSVAQSNLGSMYLRGQGVEKDYVEAEKWIRKAADQGLSIAQLSLGDLYLNGQGVAQDDAEGMKWIRKSADQGYSDAQAQLGYIYLYGRGIKQDPSEAANWFRKAAQQGNADARNIVAKLDAVPLGPDDLTSVTRTYNDNQLRFKRDFFERRFSGVLPFRGVTENPFSKGTYRVGFGSRDFLSSLDCMITAPEQLSVITDWSKGDLIQVEGIVADVTMDSVQLDPCKLSK
jgi:hypothetical protein